MGWQTDYVAEGRNYARWILANRPNAKIAVFYQNDDYGKDYLRGIKSGLGSRASMIINERSYEVTDTSYASQIAQQRRLRGRHVGPVDDGRHTDGARTRHR